MKAMSPSVVTIDLPMSASGPSLSNSKLFIGGLSYETTDESLCSYFSQFGPVVSAVVLRDQETNRSRGFGFVTFADTESAQNALNQHHHIVDGRKVESKFAVPRRKTDGEDDLADITPPTPISTQRATILNSSLQPSPTPNSSRSSPTLFSPNSTTTTSMTGRSGPDSVSPTSDIIANKIFVGGLRYATTNEALRSYFEKFGEVDTAQVIFNRDTKKSRGFGFVVFKEASSVERVLAEQKTSPPIIDGKPVEVKLCVAKQESQQMQTSPRTVPQTPIVTRSDSYSSLNSSSSVQPRLVTSTPVRPFNQSTGASNANQLLRPDPWRLTSPVAFDNGEHMNSTASSDRRASFASSVRSNSPYGSGSSVFIQNTVSDAIENVFVNASPFTSPNINGNRDSPLFSGNRLQTFPSAPTTFQRGREDSTLSMDRLSSMHQFGQTRESAFSVPESSTSNHDMGLFDMSAFSGVLNSLETIGSTSRRLTQESPIPTNNTLQPSILGFRPVSTPPPNQVVSPSRPSTVARSPLLDSSFSPAMTFSPYVSNSGKTIW